MQHDEDEDDMRFKYQKYSLKNSEKNLEDKTLN